MSATAAEVPGGASSPAFEAQSVHINDLPSHILAVIFQRAMHPTHAGRFYSTQVGRYGASLHALKALQGPDEPEWFPDSPPAWQLVPDDRYVTFSALAVCKRWHSVVCSETVVTHLATSMPPSPRLASLLVLCIRLQPPSSLVRYGVPGKQPAHISPEQQLNALAKALPDMERLHTLCIYQGYTFPDLDATEAVGNVCGALKRAIKRSSLTTLVLPRLESACTAEAMRNTDRNAGVDWLPSTLRDVVISDGPLAKGFADLAHLTALTRLDMAAAKPETVLHVVTTLTQLQRLRLYKMVEIGNGHERPEPATAERNVLTAIAEHLPRLTDLVLGGILPSAACGVRAPATDGSDARDAFTAGLQAIAGISTLRNLRLPSGMQLFHSVEHMGDHALDDVTWSPELTSLSLTLCELGVSRHAASLASLPSLRRLWMLMPNMHAPLELSACTALTALTALRLHQYERDRLPFVAPTRSFRPRTGCVGLGAFSGSFSTLQSLSIVGVFDDRITPHLRQLSALTDLCLENHHVMRGCHILEDVVAAVPPSVVKLRLERVEGQLFRTAFSDDVGMRPRLPALRKLDILLCGTLGVLAICNCPHLEVVSVESCASLTGVTVDEPSRRALRSVQLTGCQSLETEPALRLTGFTPVVSAAGPSREPASFGPSALERIVLTNVNCADHCLRPLPSLREIGLHFCTLSASTLRDLSSATGLRVCRLDRCKASHSATVSKPALLGSVALSLDSECELAKVRDLVQVVRNNRKLESLVIAGAEASAVSESELLQHLTRLTHLKLCDARDPARSGFC